MSGKRLRQVLAMLLLGALSVAVPRDWLHACVAEHDHHDAPVGADILEEPCPVCDTLAPVYEAQASLCLSVHRFVLGEAVRSLAPMPVVLPLEAPGARGPPVC